VAVRSHHELRQERQEEQHHLRVDRVGQQPFGEHGRQWFVGRGDRRGVGAAVAAQCLQAEPDQVQATADFQRGEGDG
jgi:hypothetical protein